jgi:hypothetical protein
MDQSSDIQYIVAIGWHCRGLSMLNELLMFDCIGEISIFSMIPAALVAQNLIQKLSIQLDLVKLKPPFI